MAGGISKEQFWWRDGREVGNVCNGTEDWVESSESHYGVAITGIGVF